MTDTGNAQDPASTSPDSPPTASADGRRRLLRCDEGRILTGVCAGLGRHTGIDPVLFRVGFAMLVIASGVGIMLYVAAFLLMREAGGGPGYVEQWTRRDFDGETVLALLTAVFAFGLFINVTSGGIGTATVVVGTLFAVALLTAHSRGVDLLGMARSLPEGLRRARRAVPRPSVTEPYPHVPPTAEPWTPRSPSDQVPPAAPVAQPPAPQPSAPQPPAPPVSPVAEPDPEERRRTVEEAIAAARSRMTAAQASATPAEAPESTKVPEATETVETPETVETAEATGAVGTEPPAVPRPRPLPSFDSSGAPFAPHGPYRPLDPRAGLSPYADLPFDLAAYGPPARPARPASRPRRPRAFVGTITTFLALLVGGIIMTVQSASGQVNMTVVGASVLVTIGAGLLVATWFGRGAALVGTGTVVALALVIGSTVSDVPRKVGTYHWAPTSVAQLAEGYTVGIGEGRLDLSEVVFPPGSRTTVEASVSVGELTVILPPTVRAEVTGHARIGDVKIDHAVQGGPDVRYERVLEPEVETEGEVATVVLTVRMGIGDVEVRRAA
ncbi:PspC domain-containing protein [Planomonospora corallina]|uniref:PspC domain-containing protein n=1 Tax=Planomonospora corallina TaxID=1806052 RepID=A0ABV8I109_9ACTN